VYIVYILYIVYIPYARNMHGKEVLFVGFEPAACGLADNGVIPVRLQFNTKKIPRNEGYYTELLTLYLKGERII
jgi:hypothetical protein